MYKLPVTTTSAMVGVSQHSVVQWYQYFRDVCFHYLIAYPLRIGGPGHTVQIDESLIARPKV